MPKGVPASILGNMQDFIRDLILKNINDQLAFLAVKRYELTQARSELDVFIATVDTNLQELEELKKKYSGPIEASNIEFSVQKI